MENNLENEDLKVAEQPRVGGYRFMAIFFFLLAAGGLFIGLLAPVSSVFAGKLLVANWGTVPKGLQGSLFGYIWAVCQNLFSGGTGSIGFIWEYLELILAFFLVIAVVISIVCGIVALCSKKSSKACAYTSGIMVTIAYVLFAMVTSAIPVATIAVDAEEVVWAALSLKTFDLPICIVATLCVITLFVTACAFNKRHGIIAGLGFLFAIAAYFAMTYPCSILATSSLVAILGDTNFGGDAAAIIGFALYFLLLVNVVISICRFFGKRAYVFDAIRFGFLFLVAIAYFVALIISGMSFASVFNVNTSQLIASILLLAVLLIAFIVFVCIAVAVAARRREMLDEELFAEEEEAARQEAEARNCAPTYITNINNAPAVPAQTVAQPAAPGQPPVMYLQMPQPAPYPYYPQPMMQPIMQPVIQPVIQPAPTAPVAEPEMSDFERKMLELVRGGAVEEPVPAAEPAPVAALTAPAAEPAPAEEEATPAAYVYDPFFNTLTTSEKDEFGALFIGQAKGDFGLPVYQIGGNNEVFFKNFFVYLGKFRPFISSAVLGKVHKYLSK